MTSGRHGEQDAHPATPATRIAGGGPSGWSRVATIVVVFVGVLGAMVALIVRPTWEIGIALGSALAGYRQLLVPTDPSRGPVDLVWLGDSTVVANEFHTSYPAEMISRILEPQGVRAVVLARAGLDAFGYYPLLSRALALRPRVVVLIVNFHTLSIPNMPAYIDLLGLVPLEQIPEVLSLPYYRRGASAAQVLLARAMQWPAIAGAVLWVSGTRDALDRVPLWDALGGPGLPVLAYNEMRRVQDATLEGYGVPLGRDHPVVQMIEATTALATRQGARVLVIVTPMPVQVLQDHGFYDAARDAERVAALRQATEAGGGTLLDLHLALPHEQFSDLRSHFTPEGKETMLRLTAPPVVKALVDAGVLPRAAATE